MPAMGWEKKDVGHLPLSCPEKKSEDRIVKSVVAEYEREGGLL
jgi:hypothetical protein